MRTAAFLHDALDAALLLLDANPEGTYIVVAANDDARTVAPVEHVYASKSAAAGAQTRLVNDGYRAYLAVRHDGADYLMGRFGGVDMIYLAREAPPDASLPVGVPVGEGHTWGETRPGQVFRLPDGTAMTVLKTLKHHVVIRNDYTTCTDPELLSFGVSEGRAPRHFPINPDAVLDAGEVA